jgi:hypothetical protein
MPLANPPGASPIAGSAVVGGGSPDPDFARTVTSDRYKDPVVCISRVE